MSGLIRMVMTVVMAAGLVAGFAQPLQAAEDEKNTGDEALKPHATCAAGMCKMGAAVAITPTATEETPRMHMTSGNHEGHKMVEGEKCQACADGKCTGDACKTKHGEQAAMMCKDGTCTMEGNMVAAQAAQKTCPVMGGKINKEMYADVNGKRVYVCCAGCVAKVKAEPEKYLAVLAERGEGVETLPVAEVNTQTLAILVRAGVKMTLVDARGQIESMIPGAVHLPSKASAEKVAAALPSKDALIVTYCAGTQCPASARLAGRLRQLGYSNVVEYPHGIEGWTAAGLDTEPAPKD